MKSVVVVMLVMYSVPPALEAQERIPSDPIRVLAVNAALGGITAGIARAARHESPWGALLRGSAAGVVVFAGKSIVARTKNATIVGRQVAALGESEIRNAAAGKRVFDEFVIPYGPMRIYLRRANWKPQVKLDLSTVGTATYFLIAKDAARFDLLRSLRYGTVVVDYRGSNDLQAAGVILMNPFNADFLPWRFARGHESVHVVQSDFVSAVWNEPLEKWILSAVPGGDTIHRNFDFGGLNIAWAVANNLVPEVDRPWEKEAYVLTTGYRRPF